MSERDSHFYPASAYLNDHSSLLFMMPEVCRHTLFLFLDPALTILSLTRFRSVAARTRSSSSR